MRLCVTSPLLSIVSSAWGHRRESFPLDPWHVSHQCSADGRRQQWLNERVKMRTQLQWAERVLGPGRACGGGQLPEAWSWPGSLAITLARMQFSLLPMRWGCSDPTAPGGNWGRPASASQANPGSAAPLTD